ncbi:hypothetical protein EFIBHEMM_01788 [Mannheimia haemolytica]
MEWLTNHLNNTNAKSAAVITSNFKARSRSALLSVLWQWVSVRQRRNAKKSAKIDRLEQRKRLEKLKSRRDFEKDLQKIFNKFIRLRDKDLPCISCGRYHQGKYDAGHYKTVGGNPELRFNEDNCHSQCVPCNRHLHGNIVNYRVNLIEKIGLERVEFLERKDHPPLKLTIEQIKDLIKVYKAKCKELERVT